MVKVFRAGKGWGFGLLFSFVGVGHDGPPGG